MRAYYRGLGHRSRALDRRMFQLAKVVDGPETRSEVIRRMLGHPRWPDTFPEQMRAWLVSLGLRVAAADVGAGGSASDAALARG